LQSLKNATPILLYFYRCHSTHLSLFLVDKLSCIVPVFSLRRNCPGPTTPCKKNNTASQSFVAHSHSSPLLVQDPWGCRCCSPSPGAPRSSQAPPPCSSQAPPPCSSLPPQSLSPPFLTACPLFPASPDKNPRHGATRTWLDAV
jgi:hypothetical protein